MTVAEDPILSLRGITKRFVQRVDLAGRIANAFGAGVRETVVQAVSDVDLDVAEGEVVGLVGESGCGKCTLGRIVAGILPPTAGSVLWRGQRRRRDGHRAGRPAARRADDLPGPLRLAQSAAARVGDRRRGAAGARHGARAIAADYVAETLLQVGLDPIYAAATRTSSPAASASASASPARWR